MSDVCLCVLKFSACVTQTSFKGKLSLKMKVKSQFSAFLTFQIPNTFSDKEKLALGIHDIIGIS